MLHGSVLMWLGVALVAVFLVAQFFRNPGQAVWRIVKGLALGCLFIFAVNWVGEYFHFHLPFNAATAVTAGLLGIPGVIGLVALKLVLLPVV